jgi:RNA polymerase sigma-70 factor (ECF subfamily)
MELRELIQECADNRITAQRCLFDWYAHRFFLLCQRYLKQREEAEEALMSGFLQIYQSLPDFTYLNDAATIGWMKKIMIHKCLEVIRSRHRLLSIVADNQAEDVSFDDDLYNQLAVKEILACLSKLPIGYRTVFNLFVIESYSHQEIAQLLNISEGTSKSQLNKARQYLQQLIREQQNFIRHATK